MNSEEYRMNQESISKTIENQRKFFRSGATRDVSFRIRQLKLLATVVNTNETEILDALRKDMNRPAFEAFSAEIGFVLSDIKHILKNLRSWSRPCKVKNPPATKSAKSVIYPEPYGIALVIAPWNYPFQLLLSPLVGAIAAGNCAVAKPSEISAHSSAVITKIISDNFDPGFLAVIEGGVEESSALLAERFDSIFYTGGTEVGKIVMQAAAKHLTPVTLELGGKSPCVVEPDVNLEYTARRIAWAKFFNAGQTCIAPDYLLVSKKVKADLLKKMKDCIQGFYGADPISSADYGRIINDRHFERLSRLLKDGEVIVGGRAESDQRYIAPTVIDEVSMDSTLMQEEIFGPILPVLEYDDISDAIEMINSRPRPLALYLFSRDEANQKRVIHETSSGGVCVNDTILHITNPNLPFGGIGDSGFGSYHGKASFDTFTHYKSTLKQTFAFDVKQRYPPYAKNLNLFKCLVSLQGKDSSDFSVKIDTKDKKIWQFRAGSPSEARSWVSKIQ